MGHFQWALNGALVGNEWAMTHCPYLDHVTRAINCPLVIAHEWEMAHQLTIDPFLFEQCFILTIHLSLVYFNNKPRDVNHQLHQL